MAVSINIIESTSSKVQKHWFWLYILYMPLVRIQIYVCEVSASFIQSFQIVCIPIIYLENVETRDEFSQTITQT